MKLRNKKTGEILEPRTIGFEMYSFNERQFDSLAELNEEWEDYEEPRDFWYINSEGDAESCIRNDELDKSAKEIGNYFETKEEAEKAVEKLKAWKRLKDEGFRFKDWNASMCELYFNVPDSFFPNDGLITDETKHDLDLLFGGEE